MVAHVVEIVVACVDPVAPVERAHAAAQRFDRLDDAGIAVGPISESEKVISVPPLGAGSMAGLARMMAPLMQSNSR
jgi:hypothetical protein